MTVEVNVKSFAIAKFGLLIPTTPVKGILVLVPGANEDGRKEAVSPEWLPWAEEHHLAIIGCYFKDHTPARVEQYVNAREESGEALLEALAVFRITHPELHGHKLLMWGWSAGGEFNHEFNAHFPAWVAGFVVNKGGIYYTALAQEDARDNPGLYILGTKDYPLRGVAIRGIYAVNMYAGAKWVLEEEPVEHELGVSIRMAKQFFARILGGTS